MQKPEKKEEVKRVIVITEVEEPSAADMFYREVQSNFDSSARTKCSNPECSSTNGLKKQPCKKHYLCPDCLENFECCP